MSTSLKITLILIPLILIPVLLLTRSTQLGINRTPSLPYTLFLTIKSSTFQKGDLVTIVGHPTRYYPCAHFTKHIKGISGDLISVREHKIFVNEEEIGPLQSQTMTGEPLTPLKPQIIPPNMLFVAASHDRSFDSRYQEFGLVSIHNVVGRTFVLW